MVRFDVTNATRLAIESLSPLAFEQLAWRIVRRSHPRVQPLRAPDGGADLIDDGPPKRVWQVKHYQTPNWAKCRESLQTALTEHAPLHVTFIFMRDLTAAEEKGWQTVPALAPPGVVVDRHGFSWFDEQLDHGELQTVRANLLRPRAFTLTGPTIAIEHPPSIPSFWTPRDEITADLDEWFLSGTENVCATVGLGGTGKSTVVQTWLEHRIADDKLEGIVQFSLYEHGERLFAEFVRVANEALAAPAAGDGVETLLAAMAERNALLVLDGAERLLAEYASAAPELVEERDVEDVPPSARTVVDLDAWRFLKGVASRPLRSKIVLTTRLMPLELDGAARCRRIGLSRNQAVALLRHLEIKGNDQELGDASEHFRGHPLSLARLANVLRADLHAPKDIRRMPAYAENVDLRHRRHDIFVRAFEVLNRDAQNLLLLLAAGRGLVSGPDLHALATAAGVPAGADVVVQLIDELWIELDAHANVRLHPLARRWLTERDRDLPRTHALHVGLWRPRAEAVDVASMAIVSDLRPAIELAYHLVRSGAYDKAFDFLDGRGVTTALANKFSARSLRSQLLLEFFPDHDESRLPALSKPYAQATLLNLLANDLAFVGQPIRAVGLLERALHLGANPTPSARAVWLGNLALTRLRIGQLRIAHGELEQQLAIGRDMDDLTNELVARQEKGRLAGLCGRYGEAVRDLDAARAIVEDLEEAPDGVFERCSPLDWSVAVKRRYVRLNRRAIDLAYRAQIALLRREDALSASRDAVVAAEATEHAIAIARAGSCVGLARVAAGRHAEGRAVLEELLRKLRMESLPDLEPEVLSAIARSWLTTDRATAADFASQAEVEARRQGNRLQLADALLARAQAADGFLRRRLALEARDAAQCDDPPFAYEVVLEEATALSA